MKTIAVVGQKGGTGKTMLAENLYVEARARGMTAAIIDLDPQASATRWADRRSDGGEAVVSTGAARLARVLDAAKGEGTELCILDTPARATDASLEAAKLADLVLVPVRPFMNDVETLKAVRDLLVLAGDPPAAIVLNAAPIQGVRHEHAAGVAKDLGLAVCPVVLHQRAAFADAPIDGHGVREHDPKGSAAFEISAVAKFAFKLMNSRTVETGARA